MTLAPEQFNKLALKEDVEEVKQDVKEVKENVHKMMNTLDIMSKTLSTQELERTANTSAHTRFQTALDDHEVRIKSIEKVKVGV